VALGFLPEHITDEAERQGAIAVIATAAPHGISRVIDLKGWNPVHQLVPIDDSGQTVIVATPGRHDLAEAKDGIDRISLADGTVTQILNESEINASVEEVAWGGEHEVYAITLGPEPGLNPTKVIRFDPTQAPATRDIQELAHAPWFDDSVNGAAYVHAGLALTKDHVLVGDHTPGAGRIRVFSRATGKELASIPTKAGSPPWQLLALPP
jgi:hypothetical protein